MEHLYAWAAGLFEGEGCLTWTKKASERAYPASSLGMTDEDVVRRFAEIIGVGKVTAPRRREGRKPFHVWRGFGAPVMLRLDETIGPYLGARRRAKLDEMLTFVPLRDGERGRWLQRREFSEAGLVALRASVVNAQRHRWPSGTETSSD